MKLTHENKEKNRFIINRAAVNEFYNRGFRDASLRMIGEKAGISAGNFYRYYKSKEAMFTAVISPVYKKMLQVMKTFQEHALEQGGVDTAFIETLADDVVGFIVKNRKEILVLFRGSKGTKFEDVRYNLVENFIQSVTMLFDKMAPGGASGQDVAIRIMSTSMVDSFVDIVSRYRAKGKIYDAIQNSIQFHLFGLVSFLR